MMLAPIGQDLSVPLAVALSPSAHHVGILYRAQGRGALFFFHHIGHYDLRHEAADIDRLRWVHPGLDDDELEEILDVVDLLDDKYTERGDGLPYGFDRCVTFDAEGDLVTPDPDAGLTCATFVAAVFQRAGFQLVALDTWESGTVERCKDDIARQEEIIATLGTDDHQRAASLRACIRAPHLRAEEVAAASSVPRESLPLSFDNADPLGCALLTELTPAAPAAAP